MTKMGKYDIVFASRFGRSTFAEKADLYKLASTKPILLRNTNRETPEIRRFEIQVSSYTVGLVREV